MSNDKPLPWFRLYHEAIDDPKLKLLPFECRWHFIAILCCKAQGILERPNIEIRRRMVAAKLELSTDELDDAVKLMAELDLINPKTLQPLAWDDRQKPSDKSTDRVKKHRENQKKQQDTEMKRPCNGHVTPLDLDIDKDKDLDNKKPMSSCTQPDRLDDVEEVFAYWQSTLKHPRAKLDRKRRDKIRLRLKDGYSTSDLMAAIDGIRKSAHHMGQNQQGQVYDDIELICRDAPHVDKFIKLASEPDMARMSEAARKTAQAAQRWLNEG
jgi:hypothetical protein